MAIVICRHGQTALNAALVVQPADTPLDEVGMRQAERLAVRLAATRVARVITSDLPRARMTAAPIERALGLRAEPVELLRERNFGDHRGTPYAELEVDIFAPGYQPPNGESWEDFHARIAKAWTHCVDTARGLEGDLVVVTHGLFCRTLATRHLALPEGMSMISRWGNASVTVADPEPPHLVSVLSSTTHLDETNEVAEV